MSFIFVLVCFYLILWVIMYNLEMVSDLTSELKVIKHRWLRFTLGVVAVIVSPCVFLSLILLSGCIVVLSFFQELWEGYQDGVEK